MTERPEWHDAPVGSYWLVDGRKKSGSAFAQCVAHTLDTDTGPRLFQLNMMDGSQDDDVVTAHEITKATSLTLVNTSALKGLQTWRWGH